jgi:hypothetical protein
MKFDEAYFNSVYEELADKDFLPTDAMYRCFERIAHDAKVEQAGVDREAVDGWAKCYGFPDKLDDWIKLLAALAAVSPEGK